MRSLLGFLVLSSVGAACGDTAASAALPAGWRDEQSFCAGGCAEGMRCVRLRAGGYVCAASCEAARECGQTACCAPLGVGSAEDGRQRAEERDQPSSLGGVCLPPAPGRRCEPT